MSENNFILKKMTEFERARRNTENTSNTMVSPDRILFLQELTKAKVGSTYTLYTEDNNSKYTKHENVTLMDVTYKFTTNERDPIEVSSGETHSFVVSPEYRRGTAPPARRATRGTRRATRGTRRATRGTRRSSRK